MHIYNKCWELRFFFAMIFEIYNMNYYCCYAILEHL